MHLISFEQNILLRTRCQDTMNFSHVYFDLSNGYKPHDFRHFVTTGSAAARMDLKLALENATRTLTARTMHGMVDVKLTRWKTHLMDLWQSC